MTDHSPDHAERAEVMRIARTAFQMEVSMIERDARISDLTDDETDSIIDGVLAAARAAALRGRDAVVDLEEADRIELERLLSDWQAAKGKPLAWLQKLFRALSAPATAPNSPGDRP